MAINFFILSGNVIHKRLSPKVNAFRYRIYYLGIPLSKLNKLPIALNRFGLLSFYNRDHGGRDGGDLEQWARAILDNYGVAEANGEIVLITMPRVLGYVFNPVSFWVCYDQHGNIRAILYEVHNTFGEAHSYLCVHSDHRRIQCDDVLAAQKVFHVSPFLPRQGHYTFRFNISEANISVRINYYDGAGDKQLVTALTGTLRPMNSHTLRSVFWMYPLVTLKSIMLIHWQALKLVIKGIKYIQKPAQKKARITTTQNNTKH